MLGGVPDYLIGRRTAFCLRWVARGVRQRFTITIHKTAC